ncbi:CHAT domain-containing protein, partial [Streptomyces sp. NPDC001276]|uniref:CHAT domain-containing protein n=1 Tax=Streptomyces sp. NPDC001276 TaxID=3364555 RepID=UPI0036AD676A
MGHVEALEEAAEVARQAVAATPHNNPDRALYLSSLGACLRYLVQMGRVESLEEAVEVARQAVAATPHNHTRYASHLSNLAAVLSMLFARTGQVQALEEAIELGRQAVAAAPHNHSHRAQALSSLEHTLHLLSLRTGRVEVLEEAVELGRQAVAVAASHEDDLHRDTQLGGLGSALRSLFDRTGRVEVLEEAVELGRQAVAATPHNHTRRHLHLINLVLTLQDLFTRTGRMEVLEEAVELGRQAVAATPDNDPDRAMCLSTLGVAQLSLFDRTGRVEVLEEAVELGRQAVAATPDDHPHRAGPLNNLGVAVRRLFERTGRVEVLEEAVELGRQAVAATPDDHPDRALHLSNLGDTLHNPANGASSADALDEAFRCYREAADNTAGETFVRIRAYRRFAQLAFSRGPQQSALDAMESAIELVAALAPGSLARADREHQIGRLQGLAGEAAAAALAADQPARAVELLERTRGILAADTLGMRSPDMVRLREQAPHLADELGQLRTRLDMLDGLRPAVAQILWPVRGMSRLLAEDRRDAHRAWQRLLERIRSLPSFEYFLQAPPIDELARHAHDGPLVFVATSPIRCDALILTDTPGNPVQVVPLNDLTHEVAVERTIQLHTALTATTNPRLAPAARAEAQRDIFTIQAWLWDTITEPVLTHLGHTAPPPANEPWPRVWWCPVGVLAFLPLHAAGHHTDSPVGQTAPRTVPERVVSSYATTVRALGHARSHVPDTTARTTLIVPVATPSGVAPLAGVRKETTAITALIPDANLLPTPTRNAVLQALPGQRIAHFSCHGHSDWTAPASSRLILTDHETAPLTITDIAALRLTADLAYLSACDTSVTVPRLADESLHITGAFHLAGYQHVVGTLWSILTSAVQGDGGGRSRESPVPARKPSRTAGRYW